MTHLTILSFNIAECSYLTGKGFKKENINEEYNRCLTKSTLIQNFICDFSPFVICIQEIGDLANYLSFVGYSSYVGKYCAIYWKHTLDSYKVEVMKIGTSERDVFVDLALGSNIYRILSGWWSAGTEKNKIAIRMGHLNILNGLEIPFIFLGDTNLRDDEYRKFIDDNINNLKFKDGCENNLLTVGGNLFSYFTSTSNYEGRFDRVFYSTNKDIDCTNVKVLDHTNIVDDLLVVPSACYGRLSDHYAILANLLINYTHTDYKVLDLYISHRDMSDVRSAVATIELYNIDWKVFPLNVYPENSLQTGEQYDKNEERWYIEYMLDNLGNIATIVFVGKTKDIVYPVIDKLYNLMDIEYYEIKSEYSKPIKRHQTYWHITLNKETEGYDKYIIRGKIREISIDIKSGSLEKKKVNALIDKKIKELFS